MSTQETNSARDRRLIVLSGTESQMRLIVLGTEANRRLMVMGTHGAK